MPEKVLDVREDWVPLWRAPFVFAWQELKHAFEQRFLTEMVVLDREAASARIGDRSVRLASFARDMPLSLRPFAPHEMKLGSVWSYGIASVSRQVASRSLQVWARFGHVAAPFEQIAPDTWFALVDNWMDEDQCTAQVPDGPTLFSIHICPSSTSNVVQRGKIQRTQAAIHRAVELEWPEGIPEGLPAKIRDSRINTRLQELGTLRSASPPTIRSALKVLAATRK